MVFARYTGANKEDKFTLGKVYPVWPAVDSGDTVCYRSIELDNDEGERIHIEPYREVVDGLEVETYDFEFLAEVYAVVVKPFDDFRKGQVVVVDDVDTFDGKNADGTKWTRIVYSIKGSGFHSSDWLVLLDRTNVFPGMVILDESTGNWCKVKSVDECLWVVTECSEIRQSPEAFTFSVDKDGDIRVEPFVECVDNTGIEDWITKGKKYRVIGEEFKEQSSSKALVILDDKGIERYCLGSRFI